MHSFVSTTQGYRDSISVAVVSPKHTFRKEAFLTSRCISVSGL